MKSSLIKFADHLDRLGLKKEANQVDVLLQRLADKEEFLPERQPKRGLNLTRQPPTEKSSEELTEVFFSSIETVNDQISKINKVPELRKSDAQEIVTKLVDAFTKALAAAEKLPE